MPGVYKKKVCPVCSVEHRKRGIHCGASCAGMHKTIPPETRESIAASMREYYETPEGIAQASVNNRRVNAIAAGTEPPVTIDEFTVDIPDIRSLSDYDILDDYEKGENW